MQAILGLFLRHGLTAIGGALALKEVIPVTEVDTFVGAVMFLGGLALSAWQKWRAGLLKK